jgi:hypothetical protein
MEIVGGVNEVEGDVNEMRDDTPEPPDDSPMSLVNLTILARKIQCISLRINAYNSAFSRVVIS